MMTRRSPEQSLLAGTLTTFRRRCGKPSCRCAAGDPHETPALRYTEGGRRRVARGTCTPGLPRNGA